MAVLLPRRFPPSTAGADLTTHRAEASTGGPGSEEAARPHEPCSAQDVLRPALRDLVARGQGGRRLHVRHRR